MMPVAPTAKRTNGFSIDSLMGKESPPSRPSTSTSSATSPASSNVNVTVSAENAAVPAREPTMGGIGSSFHPVHPGSGALINGLKGLYHHHDGPYHEGLTALGLPAAAIHAAANVGPGHLPPGLHMPSMHHHSGLHPHPLLLGAQRDPFNIYPWLLSRHGSYFNHPRLAGPDASLLLQPFRKPKRIRTAFSPSQLLRLEHAFEKNHYVVGQERKDLAVNLSLTETQVKVWFQNRRTKYKRMKAEEAESQGRPIKDGDTSSSHEDIDIDLSIKDEDSDEERDIDIDDIDESEALQCHMMMSRGSLDNVPRDIDDMKSRDHTPPSDCPASPSHNSPSPELPRPPPIPSHNVDRWLAPTNQV